MSNMNDNRVVAKLLAEIKNLKKRLDVLENPETCVWCGDDGHDDGCPECGKR